MLSEMDLANKLVIIINVEEVINKEIKEVVYTFCLSGSLCEKRKRAVSIPYVRNTNKKET
jgi:hypothetical protein